jgi:hypothetical protein
MSKRARIRGRGVYSFDLAKIIRISAIAIAPQRKSAERIVMGLGCERSTIREAIPNDRRRDKRRDQGNALRADRIAPELDNTTNLPFSFLISSI